MENKKDLAKIALAALILASATPVNGQADIEATGITLAAGCAAHGCPSAKNGSDSSISYQNDNVYNNQPNRTRNQPSDAMSRPEYGGTGFDRGSVTTTQDYRQETTTAPSSATLTEGQLLGSLNAQGRALYLSLDSEGKALAIQLASQDTYRDKNLAVKEAQRRMNERRGYTNR